MNLSEKCAWILVDAKYAHAIETDEDILDGVISISKFATPKTPDDGYHGFVVEVNPFINKLESREQADAIEDWLNSNPSNRQLWSRSIMAFGHPNNKHQWRLDRIKWCVEQLIKEGR